MFWISWLESDSLSTILARWSEMNRTTQGWVCRQRQTVRWSFFMRSFHCAWLKKLQGHRNRKTVKFLLWNRKKQVTVWSASDFVGPVTTRVVIALWALTRDVNSLPWVVGLSFRLLEAIPKSSFLSDLFIHPSEAGEKAKNSNRRRPEVCKSNGSSRNSRRGCEKLPREPGRSPFYKKVYVSAPVLYQLYKLHQSLFKAGPLDLSFWSFCTFCTMV